MVSYLWIRTAQFVLTTLHHVTIPTSEERPEIWKAEVWVLADCLPTPPLLTISRWSWCSREHVVFYVDECRGQGGWKAGAKGTHI